MFRRKDNEPAVPGEIRPEPLSHATEVRPLPPADLPRRPLDLPQAATVANQGVHVDASGKRLIVGHGISLAGEITACDRLIVEGDVQVTLNETRAIEIAESGRFTNGKAEVEEAEISGVYEGDLTVHNRLLIRSTGRVKGNVRYGELEIERGGKLTGSVMLIDER